MTRRSHRALKYRDCRLIDFRVPELLFYLPIGLAQQVYFRILAVVAAASPSPRYIVSRVCITKRPIARFH